VVVALRAAGRVWPRRSVGAVQGPLEPPAEDVDIWGWAWLGGDKLAAVHVTVDGKVVAGASLGPPPPDVARTRPRTQHSSRCGWRARVDLSSFANQPVKIGAFAVSQRGVVQHLAPARVRVGHPLAGAIEAPAPGTRVSAGRALVAGWALPVERPLGRVEVRVDGCDAGLARPLALPRPDIAAHRDAAGAPLAGFEHSVTLEGTPGRRVRIDVDVVDLDGMRTPLAPVDAVLVGATAPLAGVPRLETEIAPARDRPRRLVSSSRRSPRLAVFTHRLDIGGGQLYLQELLRHLVCDGEFPSLVVSEHDGPLRQELEALGAVVHLTEYPVRSRVAYEDRLAELGQLVRAHDAQVALVNTMGAGIGADIGQRLGIPTVWAIHESYTPEDLWSATYGEGGIALEVRSSILRAFARTSAVVFVADATRAAYSGIGDDSRLVTIPYGVRVDEVDEFRQRADRNSIRRAAGIAHDATVLLCVGTFDPRKAQSALAVAFADVAAEFPDTVLVLVGDSGSPYAVGLRDLVARLRIGDRIRLEPVLPDPYPWYAAADAFVIASDVESMPRSLLEAMAFRLPVVAAGVWGVPELVEDAKNGLLFPPRDVGAVIGALRRLLSLSADERACLGEAGARTVREHHDVWGYVDAYRRLLHGLTVDPRARPGALLAS
jgi:glycosyltransferase involved in cell wall biosynthesis